MPNIGPEIQVACAIIESAGRILLTQRHQDAHQGGLWEFPGGKFEGDESPTECLARELDEELGITPLETRYVCQIPWQYGEKRVRLWVYEVLKFSGTPESREGQPVDWVASTELTTRQFPAANAAIVRSIGLPRVARFLMDPSEDSASWAARFERPSLLYFRHQPPSKTLEHGVEIALKQGHRVILTLDQWPCFRPGCGLHVRQKDSVDDANRARLAVDAVWPLTAGMRCIEDWTRRAEWPADAWFISPVKPTASHAEMSPLGWSVFQSLAMQTGRPCYALGGLHPDDLNRAIDSMGYGVAGIRGFQ